MQTKEGKKVFGLDILKKGLEHVFSQSQYSVKQDRNMSKMNMIPANSWFSLNIHILRQEKLYPDYA